jgi:putative flippase GtrA
MLLVARQRGVAIREVPIQTVYLDDNASSHFNPLLDSMRIYFVLLRFAMASVVTAAIDYTVFAATFYATGRVGLSQAVARLVAMVFNYTAIKRAVFYSDQKHAQVLPKYVLLVVLSGFVSFALINVLLAYVTASVFKAKVLAEGLVFIANFAVAREFIFTRPNAAHRAGDQP